MNLTFFHFPCGFGAKNEERVSKTARNLNSRSSVYTCRQLHHRVEEHKHLVVGKHFIEKHGRTWVNLGENFKYPQEVPRETRAFDLGDVDYKR